MSFSREDISLNNSLYKIKTDALQFKKPSEEISSLKQDSLEQVEESEKVNLSDIAFNKALETNKVIEDKQTSFNLLEKQSQALVNSYDYLQEMKDILKKTLEESKMEAQKSFQELSSSVEDYRQKIDNELTKVVSEEKKLDNSDKIKDEENKKGFSSESFILSKDEKVSINNKEEAAAFLDKINDAEGLIKDNLTHVSEKKSKIETETNDIMEMQSKSTGLDNTEGIYSLIRSVANSIVQNPVDSIKMQMKNINENISLPLLGI